MADKKINGSLEITGNINNTSPLYVSQRAGYTTTPDFPILQFEGIDNRGNGYWGYLKEHILTQDRTWHLPDASGTIALTSDIPSVALNTTLNTESITVGSDTLKVMTTDTDQTISGTKTFDSNPIIYGISNSENNNTIASFNYDSTRGSNVVSTGHFIAYGDDDHSNTLKPTTEYAEAQGGDVDAYYFSTGITLLDAEELVESVKLSYPAKSGTFALTNDLPQVKRYI